MTEAPSRWVEVAGAPTRGGGQGRVHKVQRAGKEEFGALKTLHEIHLNNKERRYRMQLEVNALKRLDGVGVPRVLEDNSGDWTRVGVPLYAILEWIDGPTVAELVSNQLCSFDEALPIAQRLLETLAACHRAGIQHRDVKPDNIILAESVRPILVDFGMAWSRDDTDEMGFRTEVGQEIGNRFLRLPEFAPGAQERDVRSDVTLAAGVLLYLLTGIQPRVLQDERGRQPHEAATVPQETLSDRRWPRLVRVFRVAFQTDISLRYASAEDLALALRDLDGSSVPQTDPVAVAQARLQALRETRAVQKLEESQANAQTALRAFLSEFHRLLQPLGFQAGGNGPNYADGINAVEVQLFITPTNGPGPTVSFVHQVAFDGDKFVARYAFQDETDWRSYYSGPFADLETLIERCSRAAVDIGAGAVDRFADVIQAQAVQVQGTAPRPEQPWARNLASALLPVLVLGADVESRSLDPWLTQMLGEFKSAAENLREMRIAGGIPVDFEDAVGGLITMFDQVGRFRVAAGTGIDLRKRLCEACHTALELMDRIRPHLGTELPLRLQAAVKRTDARLRDLLPRGHDMLMTGQSDEFLRAVSRAGHDVLVAAYPALGRATEGERILFDAAHGLRIAEVTRLYMDGGRSQEVLLNRVQGLHQQLTAGMEAFEREQSAGRSTG